MASDVQPDSSPLAGSVLFYKDPQPLDSQRHAKLGMNGSDKPYGFTRGQHFVPLHVGEFQPASLSYPIIFAGDDRTPLAVLGVNAGENLFVDAEGGWRPGAYIPAFVRRYPFVSARDDVAKRMIVCIDRSFELFTEENPETPLFFNGEASEFTQRCINYCNGFDQDARSTESFIAVLKELDLFEPKKTMYTPTLPDGSPGEPVLIADYFGVSQEKLNALPEAKLVELVKNGGLSQIYAHLTSLLGWDRLIIETAIYGQRNQPANA